MKKSRIDNSVIVWSKMTNMLITLKKKTCLGVLDIEENVTKTMKTSLKEGGHRNVNLQCFPYTRCTLAIHF